MWRLYQTAFGTHHSQITTSAHSASSLETASSCSPSDAHWSTRTSRPGCSLKYSITGLKNFRSCPAMTTRSGGAAGSPEDGAATARDKYPRSRSAARSRENDAAAAEVLAAASANTAGSAAAAAATSATSSRLAANSG